MNPNDLIHLTDNPDMIEGIYNFCDRWCERCAFTRRCANFAIGQAQFPEGVPADPARDQFWAGLSSVLENTLELLQQVAVERGFDLDQDADVAAAVARSEALRSAAEAHPLTQGALAYAEMSITWLESAQEIFEAKGTDLTMLARLNVAGAAAEAQAVAIGDAVAVIQWYEDFIHLKLQRALQGQLEEQITPELWAGQASDADGSAKVALIAIDRSIGAWGQLLRHFPEQETPLLEILAHLDRLRRAAERQFPHARAFIRPGFDTVGLDDL
ncbi:MAG: hypothetical protein R2932_22930 [Caldilineaceae bacterium]